MAARPGDGEAEPTLERSPKDRRIPLKVVVFNTPTAIPGAATMFTHVEFGEQRLTGGGTFVFPQPFYDPYTRTIYIEGREFPLERVHYWERAKMASSKKPAPAPHNYRIGKSTEPRSQTPSK